MNEKWIQERIAEDYLIGGMFTFTPRKVIVWKTRFKDTTRWEFQT